MTQILLAGGKVTSDPRLDRVYPGLDAHWPSLKYLARDIPLTTGGVLQQRQPRSYTWGVPYWLDQGYEGRCVEYSICHELLSRPVKIPLTAVEDILLGKKIYWPAQQEDYWPGGSYPGAQPVYEGTSVLSGMKVAARLGYFAEYRWGLDATDAALMIGYKGPIVLGINWYDGMSRVDADGFVHVSGGIAGGHAILCNRVKIFKKSDGSINQETSFFQLHNSWGRSWGVDGSCKVSWKDMERLIAEEGEVAIPVLRTKGLP